MSAYDEVATWFARPEAALRYGEVVTIKPNTCCKSAHLATEAGVSTGSVVRRGAPARCRSSRRSAVAR